MNPEPDLNYPQVFSVTCEASLASKPHRFCTAFCSFCWRSFFYAAKKSQKVTKSHKKSLFQNALPSFHARISVLSLVFSAGPQCGLPTFAYLSCLRCLQ